MMILVEDVRRTQSMLENIGFNSRASQRQRRSTVSLKMAGRVAGAWRPRKGYPGGVVGGDKCNGWLRDLFIYLFLKNSTSEPCRVGDLDPRGRGRAGHPPRIDLRHI